MRIGNWEIVRIFATGRWSKTALAKPRGCQSNNADYVLKFLDQDSNDYGFAREMMIRELACSRLVSHATVVSFLDGDTNHKTPYLVSARHEGESLKQYQSGYQLVISLQEKLACFRQVCEGLAELHRFGIRHGDLSPSNILVDTQRRQPLIVDLGLSEKVNPFQRRTDSIAGTWGYVPPECLDTSLPINLSADIFSLGTTMQEFIFPPSIKDNYEASSFSMILESVQALLQKMTQTNPLKRPTIAEVAQQISMMEIGCIEVGYRAA